MVTQEVVVEGNDEDGYRPWMVVNRRKTRPKGMKPEDPTKSNWIGSSSLVRPNRLMMDKLEAQASLSDLRHKTNGNSGRLEVSEEKTSLDLREGSSCYRILMQ